MNAILEHEDTFQCVCGGAPLKYYHRAWEDSIGKDATGLSKQKSAHMVD
jgi:hypothetical protein